MFYPMDSDRVIKSNIPGLEAIQYQVSSSLGKKLTALFQDVINYRDNLIYLHNTEDKRREERIKKVYDYFKKETGPKFTNIVKNETGLEVSHLYAIGGLNHSFYGYFAVDLSFGKEGAAAETLNRMTGLDDSKYTRDREVVEDFKLMADNIDLKTSKITKTYFGKNKKHKIAVKMYFDVNCAFLIQDFLIASAADPFTAEEIAAIMMHEIGHAFATVEHSADVYAVAGRLQNFIKDVSTRKDLNNVIELVDTEIMPVIKGMVDKTPQAKKLYNTANVAVKTLKKAYSDEIDTGSMTGAVLQGSLLVFGLSIGLVLSIVLQLVLYIYMIHMLYNISKQSYLDDGNSGKKASDLKINFNNTFLIERWADEFVARHGYGAPLASGLIKIGKYFSTFGGEVTNYRLRHSTVFNGFCNMFGWVHDKLGILHYLDPIGYENEYNRNKRILENTYGMFRNANLPGPIADQWINSVETLVKHVKDSKTASDTEFAKAVYNTLHNLMDPVRWVTLLYNGGLTRDTEILANRIDAMANNSLYYLSTKLSRR